MTFKPYPWLTFFTLLVFSALITLGVWQVNRYEWKTKLVADIAQRSTKSPIAFSEIASSTNLENSKFLPIEISGRYIQNQQILMRGSYKKLERVVLYGYYVFTPFEFLHNDALHQVIVERGFIPDDIYKRPTAYKKLPVGQVSITGTIKLSEKQGSFLPDNVMNDEVWFWRDIAAMGKKLLLKNNQIFYISLTSKGDQAFPKPTKLEIKSASNHLSYLITWFALAASLFILYIYMHAYNGRLYLNKKSNPPTNEKIP